MRKFPRARLSQLVFLLARGCALEGLSLTAGGPFSVKMAERASGSTDPGQFTLGSDGAPWLPERVKDLLEEAFDFAAFKRSRSFRFLHLFSGKQDVLGIAIQDEAAKAGIQAGGPCRGLEHRESGGPLGGRAIPVFARRQSPEAGMPGTLVPLVGRFPLPGGMPMDLVRLQFVRRQKYTGCPPTTASSSDKPMKALCWRQEVAP